MAEQEILSPPYPAGSPTAPALFAKVQELRDWVLGCRDGLADVAEIPVPRELPELRIYTQLGVVTHFSHVVYMCELRKAWDHLVRTYEDAWDCRASLQQRAALVADSSQFFATAFLDNETREAKALQIFKRLRKYGKRFHDLITGGAPGEDDDADEDGSEL